MSHHSDEAVNHSRHQGPDDSINEPATPTPLSFPPASPSPQQQQGQQQQRSQQQHDAHGHRSPSPGSMSSSSVTNTSLSIQQPQRPPANSSYSRSPAVSSHSRSPAPSPPPAVNTERTNEASQPPTDSSVPPGPPEVGPTSPTGTHSTAPPGTHPTALPRALPYQQPLHIDPRIPFVMAAQNAWTPVTHALFWQPNMQQYQPYQQGQYQQHGWYYYPAAVQNAGLPVTCAEVSPWWPGTAHYRSSRAPPHAMYSVEPAYIMPPQPMYYQQPAAAAPLYYTAGAPGCYYAYM
ncbi:hypothetical protein SAMD00023353_3800090 [Rosellinia necatrix]|uniref:Uncharacterized protein n=1 Tax=Rosellinia necatrix TaxID=77044 RepID=A0A1W2TMD6_ROSNE|nr:hypothetical protein SAMD00023353_3800090 [Rosellinia necatrix]